MRPCAHCHRQPVTRADHRYCSTTCRDDARRLPLAHTRAVRRATDRVYMQRVRAQRRAQHLCVRCGDDATPGRRTCGDCRRVDAIKRGVAA